MVVRHYPDTAPPPTLNTTPRHNSFPQTSISQTPLTPNQSRNRHQHVSGTMSEPPCPHDAPLLEPPCPNDTPKKPPRPLDSVLRERCKSNNELDLHFKTVHNPKRLSQIYGDNNLFLRFELSSILKAKIFNKFYTVLPDAFHVCQLSIWVYKVNLNSPYFSALRT